MYHADSTATAAKIYCSIGYVVDAIDSTAIVSLQYCPLDGTVTLFLQCHFDGTVATVYVVSVEQLWGLVMCYSAFAQRLSIKLCFATHAKFFHRAA